jgi:hypothetical protein
MNEASVTWWLNSLTDKQFVEFFYRSLSDRHIYQSEQSRIDSRLVLGNASRELDDDEIWGDWEFHMLCPSPNLDWVDDPPICQFGQHCGLKTASWAKGSICPVCREDVQGT